MSALGWLKRELSKSVVWFLLLVAAGWKYEAMQTGRTYDAIADERTQAMTEALAEGATEWLLSFGPRVGMAIITAPMLVYVLYRGRLALDAVEQIVARNGLLRSLGYAVIVVGMIGLWFEAASNLPPWARPEALVRPPPAP